MCPKLNSWPLPGCQAPAPVTRGLSPQRPAWWKAHRSLLEYFTSTHSWEGLPGMPFQGQLRQGACSPATKLGPSIILACPAHPGRIMSRRTAASNLLPKCVLVYNSINRAKMRESSSTRPWVFTEATFGPVLPRSEHFVRLRLGDLSGGWAGRGEGW